MPNIFRNEDQRKKWNAYNSKYSKEKYRTITLKLNKEKDKDVIDFLTDKNGTVSDKIRKLVRNR